MTPPQSRTRFKNACPPDQSSDSQPCQLKTLHHHLDLHRSNMAPGGESPSYCRQAGTQSTTIYPKCGGQSHTHNSTTPLPQDRPVGPEKIQLNDASQINFATSRYTPMSGGTPAARQVRESNSTGQLHTRTVIGDNQKLGNDCGVLIIYLQSGARQLPLY